MRNEFLIACLLLSMALFFSGCAHLSGDTQAEFIQKQDRALRKYFAGKRLSCEEAKLVHHHFVETKKLFLKYRALAGLKGHNLRRVNLHISRIVTQYPQCFSKKERREATKWLNFSWFLSFLNTEKERRSNYEK